MKQFFLDSIAKIKGAWAKWSIVKRSIFIGVIALIVLVLIGLSSLNTRQPPVSIFSAPVSDIALQERISGRLESENISYSMSSDGTRFFVNDERTARKARALLVREGINLGQMDPWALFDIERWNQSDLLNNVNLQRSLQKQIQIHIESLEDVDRAEVSLAFPREKFLDPTQFPVTASVTIMPRPGSDISDVNSRDGQRKVRGLQDLVRFAVPQLLPENIVITDNWGVRLNDFENSSVRDMDDRVKSALQRKQQMEHNFIMKIRDSLNTIYPGRIQVVNIDLTLDNDLVKEKSIEVTPIILKPRTPGLPYDDSQFVDRVKISEQISSVEFSGTGFNPQGPPGQEGNTPPAYQDLQNTTGIYNQNTSSINYIVNQATRETEKTPGATQRLTASVAIDGMWQFVYDEKGQPILEDGGRRRKREFIPASAEEIQKLQELVQDALGYDPLRQDNVTVHAMQFDRSNQQLEEDSAYRADLERAIIIKWSTFAFVFLVVALILYRFAMREAARKRREREEEANRQHQAMREAALRSLEQEKSPLEASAADKARMELQENAIMMARERPEDVAQLIRTWLSEEN
ncbi:flagellar basal-body MS-ring/collar protein FliF [Entomospira entomophila]|uniref:Flagellar M-ring protein FliF n=1 Tax=Entomospira entomophila TaxID=2719988 RepID=A0A968GAE8_9SPIO|nr:flagellar basal-body MS-ring/collar protein FliF [Entomospira entomophilus]NIZ40043.1 flagellar M-ring protein FliF [Entomospira entomophilus]WDI35604.1 flagellar basal-body MS-ring/collar protein FliF [Entomospira entomophilus]